MSRKKYSFAELERLIKQSQQTKKGEVKKYRLLYRQKLNLWASSWQLGRAKLLTNQQKRRQRKQAALRVQQAKQAAKQQKQQRLQEIYSYFRQELNKQDKKISSYFTPHLDLPPHLASYVRKLQKQHPDYDPWRDFGAKYTVYKLNKQGSTYLLKQTRQAYQEELISQANQLKYYKDKIGSLNPNTKEFLKSEQFKYFFPEKGEHKELFRRRKEFIAEREKILTEFKGQQVKSLSQLLGIYKRLYQKSPWRIRDRFIIPVSPQPTKSVGMGEIWDKYFKKNTDYPFSYSRKHYLRAIGKMLRKTRREGELVPDSEVELDKYGNPKFKEGQWIVLDSDKPGRKWSVYKNVPSLEKQFEKEIHFEAQASYIKEYGTELEKDIFFNRRKKNFLCIIEAAGFDCRQNQGTSEPWCFFCIQWGNPYHPPVLPIHCPWRYTFKTWMCGSVEHREANKQWHWSLQGEKTNVAGKDWGSCHIGRYDYKKKSKR
ncbi:MAG: hypothetical protein MRERV_31c004 [Mycoplasmataceae bacterium RV_VA103A]|nr:MAG: hypothetical protein MRERV_31c004 [Mycoplasmataceae bacterium RV_VA103A]